MLKELDDYDWENAFGAAGKDGSYVAYNLSPAPPTSTVSIERFGREDVAEIIKRRDGEHDQSNWMLAGKLNDGRFFFLSAGCDYTGWD